MKCTNCGHESPQDFAFCPACGEPAQAHPAPPAEAVQSPAAQRILPALQDTLFLALCILMSVSCLLTLSSSGLPLLNILVTVFMWLAYSQATKGIADENHLRCVSGTVFAMYVINYVLAVLILVCGVIITAAFSFLTSSPEHLETLLSEFADVEVLATVTEVLPMIPSGLILFVFLFASALLVVMNIFSMRYLHRFIQSVYRSLENGVLNLVFTRTAMIWLFVIGGLNIPGCLSALSSSFATALLCAVNAALCFVAGLLIRNHLLREDPVQQPEQ